MKPADLPLWVFYYVNRGTVVENLSLKMRLLSLFPRILVYQYFQPSEH